MADLYYFPVNPAEWLAGEATSAMTPSQEGAFFRLLCRQWMSTELPCSLPNDDTRLAQLSRLGADWGTVGAFVREQFEEVKGDPTRIRNPKLWGIWREKQVSHRRRVIAGRIGGEAKAKGKKGRSNATALVASGEAMPKQLESELEQENKQTGYPAEFELLWNAYPRKPGSNKRQTYRLYLGHLKAGIDFDTMHSGALRYTAYATAKGWVGTEFIKAAQVFFGRDQHFLLEWECSDLPMNKEQRAQEQFRRRGYIT